MVLVATLTIFLLAVLFALPLGPPVPDGVALGPAGCRNPHPAMPSMTTTATTRPATFLMPTPVTPFGSATTPLAR